jgi:hypothetical protein
VICFPCSSLQSTFAGGFHETIDVLNYCYVKYLFQGLYFEQTRSEDMRRGQGLTLSAQASTPLLTAANARTAHVLTAKEMSKGPFYAVIAQSPGQSTRMIRTRIAS